MRTCNANTRIDANSLALAKQAAAYRGMKVSEYISHIVGRDALKDMDEMAKKWSENRGLQNAVEGPESGTDYV